MAAQSAGGKQMRSALNILQAPRIRACAVALACGVALTTTAATPGVGECVGLPGVRDCQNPGPTMMLLGRIWPQAYRTLGHCPRAHWVV